MNYYIYKKSASNITYSIDNLRISFDLQYEDNSNKFYSYLQKLLNCPPDEVDVKYYMSIKVSAYRHLFTFKSLKDDRSFTIEFCHNSSRKNIYKGVIDFNPNKVGDWNFFNEFYKNVNSHFYKKCIKRFDLAVDIPIQRDMILVEKDRREYQLIIGRTKTEYLGQRNSHNFVKVYDKKYESNLDYELTRVEITLEPTETFNLPNISIKCLDNIDLYLDLTPTDKVLFQLLSKIDEPFLYIRQLEAKKKAKFKELMKHINKQFEYDYPVIWELLGRCDITYVKGYGKYDENGDYMDSDYYTSFDITHYNQFPFAT